MCDGIKMFKQIVKLFDLCKNHKLKGYIYNFGKHIVLFHLSGLTSIK